MLIFTEMPSGVRLINCSCALGHLEKVSNIQAENEQVDSRISLAYEASGQPIPMAVRVHSSRSIVASKAILSGETLQDV